MNNYTDNRRARALITTLILLLIAAFAALIAAADGDAVMAAAYPAAERSALIPAVRGGIYDRKGTPLVVNRPAYAVVFDYLSWDESRQCETILKTLEILRANGVVYSDSLPVSYPPYSYTGESPARLRRFLRYYGLSEELGAEEAMAALAAACRVPEEYTEVERRRVIGVLYELCIADFKSGGSYTIAEDVGRELVAELGEAASLYPGLAVRTACVREYMTASAPHILGRVGRIPAAELEDYQEKGYPMNATVGLDGAEYAFEDWLRGKDGLRRASRSAEGELSSISDSAASPGGDVYLTIDIALQEAAENALAGVIETLTSRGSEAEGGAAVVLDVKSGEILALASYPGYNLQSFSADYPALAADAAAPLVNRAIVGLYAPGSTFKPITAAAALDTAAIDAETTLDCTGLYEHYAPANIYRCWLYSEQGRGHGAQNVGSALMNSCNCFFYEAGRLTGIDAIERLAKAFGLGSYTGIELRGEAKGSVASRISRALAGGRWYAGDTLAAAIGQSDTLATPLQLARYTAALATGELGSAHILKEVRRSGKLVYGEYRNSEKIPLSAAHFATLREGLLAVTEDGTAGEVFKNFRVSVLGKSGSAQVGSGRANAVFIAAAPADAPRVAVSVVIEHGESGVNAAKATREIIAACERRGYLNS